MRSPRWSLLLMSLAFAGCGDDAPLPADSGADDGGRTDAGPERWVHPSCEATAGPHAPLATRCQHFVDGDGRVVVLRGVNARVEGVFDVTFDDGRTPLEPIPTFDASDAIRMRELGFNVLRLPMNWSAVEPTDAEPPTYDSAYLERVATIVDLCADAGVLVLLDFHQDAYSKHIGEDGAPLWAIQPPPTELLEGPLDDLEARRTSAQVTAAFATFFGDDEPGPTLRTRFASMAAHVAETFAGDTNVVGIEVFNEPIGSFAEVERLNVEVATAIRAADPNRLVFFEPPVLPRNITERSGLPSAAFPVDGTVYAPHVYTLSFFGSDTQRMSFTRDTLRRGHESAAMEAVGWGTPLFVGEWGYDPEGIRSEDYYRFQLDLQDEFGASAALWLWKENSQDSWGLHEWDEASESWSERPEVLARFERPRPERIAGWPITWAFDDDAGLFELRYTGDAAVTAPTELFVPEGEWALTCDGETVASERDPATGLVAVDCAGPGEHTVQATR